MSIKFPFDGIDLTDNSIIVEIGTGTGRYSLEAWRRFKTHDIHAIEPARKTYRVLQQKTRGTPIRIHNVAISRDDGQRDFHEYTNSSSDSLFDRHSPSSKHFQRGRELESVYPVRTCTLLTFLYENKIDKVDLLIMNCEGAEIDILEQVAGSGRLQESIQRLSVDFHPQIHGDVPTVKTLILLERHYRSKILDRDRLGICHVRFERMVMPTSTRSILLRLRLFTSYLRDITNRLARRIKRYIVE